MSPASPQNGWLPDPKPRYAWWITLGGPWKLLKVARIMPAPLRDWLYDRFAGIRYRVFGRYDSCPLPPAEVRARFLDS